MSAAIFLLGLLFLYIGAESLVFGSRSFSLGLGVSPLITGLTVVAMATSSPELFVSIHSAVEGEGGIALGNIVGSNIANLSLILGSSAMIRPVTVHFRLFRFDLPYLLAVTLLFLIFRYTLPITRWEGAFFLFLGIVYTLYLVRFARQERMQFPKEEKQSPTTIYAFIVGGIILLLVGARLLVLGATAVAHQLGLSDAFIGLTIVAIGTSLPEWATSIVACVRKQGDLVVGNIIGSNIYNLVFVFGLTALVQPFSVPSMPLVSYLCMLIFSLLALPFMRTGFTLVRWEGAILLVGYFLYLWFLPM